MSRLHHRAPACCCIWARDMGEIGANSGAAVMVRRWHAETFAHVDGPCLGSPRSELRPDVRPRTENAAQLRTRARGVSLTCNGGGYEIRTREGVNPTAFQEPVAGVRNAVGSLASDDLGGVGVTPSPIVAMRRPGSSVSPVLRGSRRCSRSRRHPAHRAPRPGVPRRAGRQIRRDSSGAVA
jgi:hypothetical protein